MYVICTWFEHVCYVYVRLTNCFVQDSSDNWAAVSVSGRAPETARSSRLLGFGLHLSHRFRESIYIYLHLLNVHTATATATDTTNGNGHHGTSTIPYEGKPLKTRIADTPQKMTPRSQS